MKNLYKKQIEFQNDLLRNEKYDTKNVTLPEDNIYLFKYHMLQLLSELGEVLESDKRWKNYRNKKFNLKEKQNEIADCFIVLMNVAMSSGMTYEELYKSIEKKMDENLKRIENEK